MSDLSDLYQELIKDHNKSPRNFRALPDATKHVEGYNPLCGDQYTVYLKVADGVVQDATFQGKGCAISKASASLMTQSVKGKTVAEAEALFRRFHEMLMGTGTAEGMGKLAVFSGVRNFPVRVKCATLPWHTLHAALEGQEATVSTEE